MERRAHAAAALAGIRWQDLAAALSRSQDTLSNRLKAIDAGKEQLPGLETPEAVLRRIAGICGVPYNWFTVDFGRLEELD